MLPQLLIVEDDPDIVSILLMQAEMRGYTALAATSIKEAITILSKKNIFAIILDFRLSKEHGFQLIAHVRQNITTKDIPIIAFSAQDDERTIQTAFELGINEFVSKPSSIETIFNYLPAPVN